MIKVVFLGKHPKQAGSCEGVRALELLLDNPNVEVVGCVPNDKDFLWEFCKGNFVPIKTIKEVEEEIDQIDLVISYGFMKKIKEPLISSPRIGCINFHPAPLPEWRGMGGTYNYAIFEGVEEWGVTGHFVDEGLDTGDIIQVDKFKIDTTKETPVSLSKKSHKKLLILFGKVVEKVVYYNKSNKPIPRIKQGKGRYISKNDFDKLRKIDVTDTAEIIDKKIKAFWYPPHHGAYITIGDSEYSLVNKELLKKIKTRD